ncbi:MAG TPA: universal stress protein [Saprospiraceae bacterium]|nr:universal stress protein [Saprospiraceae bacterium]HNT21386.1 universal stress protein [Saprospiraceae bacterium]
MKNILVPTDFSELSRVAARYAVRLIANQDIRIHLLHVKGVNPASHALINMHKLETEMDRAAEEDGRDLVRELSALGGNKLKIRLVNKVGNSLRKAIDEYAEKQHIDLIVMGSGGADGLKKALVGSNAVTVINESRIPVIVVPANASFEGLQDIVYATDMNHLATEMDQMSKLARWFGAKLHILHVIRDGKHEKIQVESILATLEKLVPGTHLEFHTARGSHIAEAIDHFVTHKKADLVALFTHKLEFYEKLFDTGVTRQMAYQNHIPMLAFNKTTHAELN